MLYVFTNEEMLKNLKEADFGFVGYYLEHGRRREWSKKMKEDIKETLDDEFDSDWIQSVMEDRMRLDV